MIAEYLIPLTAAFAVAAVTLIGGTLMARRRMAGTHEQMRRLNVYLDDRAALLPTVLKTARANLAEQDAAIELQLWRIARFDTALTGATAKLAKQRRSLDKARLRLESSRTSLERLKSAWRLIMRAIELRRTILG